MSGCGGCGRALPDGAGRCVYCGHSAVAGRRCPSCDRPVSDSATRCVYCGPLPDRVEDDLPLPDFSAPPATAARVVPKVIAAAPGAGKARLLATPRERMIGAAIAAAFTLAAVLSCVYYWPRSTSLDDETLTLFQPHLDRLASPARTAETGAPRVIGLLLPVEPFEGEPMDEERMHEAPLARLVETRRWQVSELYGLLPPERVAPLPDLVGTVAVVDCGERTVGHYEYSYG